MCFSIKGHILQGENTRPVIIFVHGLGLSSRIWTDMLNYRVLAGYLPIISLIQVHSSVLYRIDHYNNSLQRKKLVTLWDGLRGKGFNLICWSESKPYNSIVEVVKELKEVVTTARISFPDLPIALIGHSRGGLIARKYMEQNTEDLRALITISTPHRGSSIAKFGIRLSNFFQNLLDRKINNPALQGLISLIRSQALHELYPGSNFLKCLNDIPYKHIKYISFGGNNPFGFIKVFQKHPNLIRYLNILAHSVCPDELVSGKGDGFVTVESAHLPWADHHYTLPDNHASILCNHTVIEIIANSLKGL